jgi:hypothetical protein
MNDEASAKIRMIKSSLHCFTCGMLGLLPVIGLPFAVAALVISPKVRAGQQRFWNPARPYWMAGVVCAAIGIIFWVSLVGLITAHAMYNL